MWCPEPEKSGPGASRQGKEVRIDQSLVNRICLVPNLSCLSLSSIKWFWNFEGTLLPEACLRSGTKRGDCESGRFSNDQAVCFRY
jgi:hypothetical protein